MADEQHVLTLLRQADPAARLPQPERSFDPLRQRVNARIARLEEEELDQREPDTGKATGMETTTAPAPQLTPPRRTWIAAAAAAVVIAAAVGTFVATRPADVPDTVAPATSVYEEGTILHLLDTDGRFDTFLSLLEEEGEIIGFISSRGFDRTMFVPTDEAFAQLDEATMAEITDGPRLGWFIHAHMLAEGQGGIRAEDLTTKDYQNPGARTLTPVTVEAEHITYGGATVIETNIEVDGGIVHVIDGVVIPWAR